MKRNIKIDNEDYVREMPTFAASAYADLDTFKVLVEHGGNYEPAEGCMDKNGAFGQSYFE